MRMKLLRYSFIVCVWLLLPDTTQAQFGYTNNNSTITITKYTGPGGVVIIPDTINGLPVTSINWSAYSSTTKLLGVTSVTVPNGVTSIGHDAFYNCHNLTSITIPDSVTNIGRYAFYYCTNLADVAIPTGITVITNFVFSYCSSLTNITVPSHVTFIGSGAFKYCANLKSIYFKGNAPALSDGDPFEGDTNLTVYHLDGTAGWGSRYGGRPTALWKE